MDLGALESQLVALAAKAIDVDPSIIKLNETFDQFGADSLDFVSFIMAIEDFFDVEIPDTDAEKLTTIQLAAEYLQNKLS